MKDKAITYLMKNPLLHMEMIEPIRRGTAEIIYSGSDGVLIKEEKSNAYMITVDNFEKGKELLDGLSNCHLMVAHQDYMVDYIRNKFGLTEKLECFQAVYMSQNKLDVQDALVIRQLEPSQIEVILEHYDKLSANEIEKLLVNGALFGGYYNETLIGFVGNHLEGSIGLLEVFPPYRGLGYGRMLESYIINKMLDNGLTPFAQVETDNEKSINLHKKLGFNISEDILYWIF